jgi:MFS family permease
MWWRERVSVRSIVPPAAYRWNFMVLGADITFFSLALTFASTYGILPLFVHHLTTSNVALGLIPAVSGLGAFLPPIFVAPLLQRRARRKPFILVLTIFERLPYLAFAVLTLALAPAHPAILLGCFFVLFALGTAAGGACVAAWLDFVARVMPDDWRGRFFGLWVALGMLLGIAGGVASAAVLSTGNWRIGFALCFGCAAACLALAYAFLALAREPATPGWEAPRTRLDWHDYVALLQRDRDFSAYLAANSLVTLASLAVTFYVVDAKQVLGLTDAGAGLYAAILMSGTLIGNLLWGYVGDHAGHKRLVEGGALCIGLAAGIALLGHAVGGATLGFLIYGLAFAVVGVGASGAQMANATFVLDFGTDTERPAYIGLASLAQLPFACGGPILGGILADHLGIGVLFALSLLLGVTGTGVVRRLVRDPRRGARRDQTNAPDVLRHQRTSGA